MKGQRRGWEGERSGRKGRGSGKGRGGEGRKRLTAIEYTSAPCGTDVVLDSTARRCQAQLVLYVSVV